MKKLAFLITAWLVHVVCANSSDNTKTDVERTLDRIYEEMLSSLTKSLSIPLDRQKRDIGVEKQSLDDDTGVYRLVSVKPVSKLCHPAIHTLFLDVSNTTYAVCISALTIDSPAEVVVGYYRGHTWTPFNRWYVNNPVKAAAFYFKNHIYVLIADSEVESGTQLVKINLETNALVRVYDVTSNYATSIAVWNMRTNGKYNLAIANSVGFKDAADLSSEVFVYEWQGTYFDSYASFRAYDVKDVEPFHIHGAAYMAVANFRRGKNHPRVDSEILRYDLDGHRWVSHQKIRTYGAMDWEFFSLGTSLGQEFFLAVANKGNGEPNVKSMIYKFVEDKFVPFQCLPTTRATSFTSFSNGAMFILAVANEDDAVHLYQYDGWRFVRSGVQSTRGAMSDGAVHLEFHSVMSDSENALILSVSNPKHALYQSVFEMGFFHENSLKEWHVKSTEWCLNTLSKMESTDIDKTIGSLGDVIFTDQPSVTINGDVVFEKGFVTDSLKTSRLKEISAKEVFDSSVLNKLADLQKRLEAVKQKLDGFSDVLRKSLKIEGNQTITSRLEFQDATFNCTSHTCRFENIYTEVLNGESIADWANHLVFLDSEQSINGTLMAREINASSIHVFDLIDGVNSQNLVTKSGSHSITGDKTFNNLITAVDLGVSGKVDGVTISPSNVLITTGHQTVHGEITIEDVETTWLNAEYVNGKKLSEFYDDLILTDKSYTITGEKTFSGVTIDELVMTPGSTINGVDLMDLWRNALWTNGNQEIKAQITFSDVMFKNLKITHGINGIQIPGPRIVDITEPANITAPQIFKNTTGIRSLEVLESLNGISLVQAPDGSKELDILLKTKDQIVTGTKTFHVIHLDANSDVKGTVDGVDLSEFKASVLRKNASIVTNGTWVFNNLVIKGPLTVEGRVSGVKLEDVYRRALKLNDSEIPEIVFKDMVDVEDLQSNNINGINVRSDLVLKNEAQILTGKKTFSEVVLLEENAVVQGLVNNMNFSFLDEILLRIGNQHIKSKVFKRDVSIRNLDVRGVINGVAVTDIVKLNGGQIFGSRILKNVNFTTIKAKNVEVDGKVNNIDVQEMMENTMTYDGEEVVTGVKDVKGTVYIMNGTNLQTTNLNGINLQALWEDAVFIDVPQQIIGEKVFEDNVVFSNLSFNGTIDGISDWDMRYNWMLTDVPQTVEGNVIFENEFSARDLKVNRVNNLDLKQLESEIVKVDEATRVNGTVIFAKSVISEGDISLTGKVQGVDLSEEAVLRDRIVVTGDKTFSQDLVIQGDLTVDGLVDGINIEDLCNKTFLRNEDVNISRLIIKGDVNLLEESTVDGTLAGVDLSLFKEIAVKNDGSEITFTGVKTFTNLTLAGPVTLKGKFGNVDLKELAENYMSLTKNQEIPAKMMFDDLSFEGILSVANFDTSSKEINNVNLQKLDKVLRTSGTQNVTAIYHIDEAHFASDVFVAGKVNGLDLPSGLMRRNHTNYIQSPKIFEQVLSVRGDLEMEKGKTIQDVDVSDWAQKAVLDHGKFHVHGHKTFNKLDLNDVKVEGMFDGLKISEKNLLMTYGDQVVTGRKVVTGSVDVKGSLTVNGLINTINLTSLSQETLQRDRNNTVTGLKYFKQPLTIISLEAPTVAGVDIIGLKAKLNTSIDLNHLENQLDEIEEVVTHMQIAFDNQAVLFEYYELFDEFDISSAYDWLYVSGQDCGELLLLSYNSSSTAHCSNIRIFGYDKTVESFIPARQELSTSYAVSVKSLMWNNVTYIFVANRNSCCSCLGNLDVRKTTLDIYAWDVDEFAKVQSLEMHQPVDMVVFKAGDLVCVVVLEISGTKVYCASGNSRNFTVKEDLLSRGQKASVLHSLGITILAITAEDTTHLRQNYHEGQSYIDIYVWNTTKAAFSTRKQVLLSTSPRSIALMSHAYERSEEVYLVIAEGSIPVIHNEPKINVYRYEESSNNFEKYQEIKDYGILEWITVKTGELIFFATDSQQGQIKVYQHKGVSGFVKIDTIKSLGVASVHAFVRSNPEDSLNHYLALAGHACEPQTTQDVYYAKILKSKLKGTRPIY